MPHVEAAQLHDYAFGQAGLLCTTAGTLSSAGIGVDTTGTATPSPLGRWLREAASHARVRAASDTPGWR
ncbi:hypothetical protein MW290_03690 [Aquincola tertiaricarbonis]|uniref:Uncharacterized protein n=1 Tax=Aquincola tertiaricarbonis TaxID=391953 RepID=A0ABY4S731_AQUTE|nr:hypothetical protein [Aquincola tertiaricarbonis]URI08485.1 hypothetical protein MW290_03690 [Aquincola tertiaricarbonis]|tara:strand:- start:169 stop:375 length:207 start_codon:yes stop_codon:yes gene_type:complete